MAFARAEDHLDHDEIRMSELFVPRPASSVVFRVKDTRLTASGIFPGDIAIVERDQLLRPGRVALVSVDGKTQLVRIVTDGGRLTFEDLPPYDVSVDVLGIATRLLRIFVS